MAPFWAMLRYMQAHNLARKCLYFFGAVRPPDLFFLEEMKQLSDRLEWFEFIPALSGPEEEVKDWSGEKGLITEVVGRRIEDGANMEAYLCGSPGMIDAAIAVLKQKGITDERTFYDKFA